MLEVLEAPKGLLIQAIDSRSYTNQGPGWQWYNGSGHDFQLPVVEELSTGKKFIVSEATPPDILDVSCRTPSTELTWSQTTGEVKLQGETAFRLDPVTGAISGTPLLSFLSAQGRGEVNVTCKVAIGGKTTGTNLVEVDN